MQQSIYMDTKSKREAPLPPNRRTSAKDLVQTFEKLFPSGEFHHNGGGMGGIYGTHIATIYGKPVKASTGRLDSSLSFRYLI